MAVTDLCVVMVFFLLRLVRMRDLLPRDWSSQHRHKFFVEHLHGIEMILSVEVAHMCPMLADFPEPNGWDLEKHDVFAGKILENIMAKTMIFIGNHPLKI